MHGDRKQVFSVMITESQIGDLVLICRLEENGFALGQAIFQSGTKISGYVACCAEGCFFTKILADPFCLANGSGQGRIIVWIFTFRKGREIIFHQDIDI